MRKAKVLIIMGSQSDKGVMSKTGEMLDKFGISHEMVISSAHRNPQKIRKLAQSAEKRGIKVIIAGAGMAAHLAGVIASQTTLPVIGVPLASSPLKGIDSFLSTLQMPSGVPVATVAIGEAGAKNAAVLAAQILALKDEKLKKKLKKFKRNLGQK